MTHTDQANFILELCNSVRDKLVLNVHNHPEDWDGHELRQLISDAFKDAAYIPMDRKRMKEYKNTVIVNNL
jgi:hypothetical protein